MSDVRSPKVSVQLIGGPTALIEIGGLRLLTDPTFDPPRTFERDGQVYNTKFNGPAVSIDDLGTIDAILLSHEQHPDNLDTAGREYLEGAAAVFTTSDSAERLGNGAHGMAPWESTTFAGANGQSVTITAVPAQHGPTPEAHKVTGIVAGFLIGDSEGHSVYVSGDNASVDVVREIVERTGTPDVTVLFMGGASLPFLFDGGFVTLDASRAVEAGGVLEGSIVIPAHLNGWDHYTDTEADVVEAFSAAGRSEQLRLLSPGDTFTL